MNISSITDLLCLKPVCKLALNHRRSETQEVCKTQQVQGRHSSSGLGNMMEAIAGPQEVQRVHSRSTLRPDASGSYVSDTRRSSWFWPAWTKMTLPEAQPVTLQSQRQLSNYQFSQLVFQMFVCFQFTSNNESHGQQILLNLFIFLY